MEQYKQDYNKLLKRYYNGCDYLESHPDEFEKYQTELLKIINGLDKILIENNITDKWIISHGFEE